jgi:hypothetical protein
MIHFSLHLFSTFSPNFFLVGEILPSRSSKKSSEILHSEKMHYFQYKNELEQNIKKLAKATEIFSGESTGAGLSEVEVPLVDDLVVLLGQASEITESLKVRKKQFFSLIFFKGNR